LSATVATKGVVEGSATTMIEAPRKQRAWIYTVLVLTFVYTLNFVDRQIVNILAEPIKQDLGLQDWQLGVLTGLAFSLMYGVTAIPVARLAERHRRPRLIAASLGVWSAATVLCSFASGFGQLAAARVAVGVGESGFTPASHSLMTDTVPRARRTLAFGIFTAGLPLGGMVAMALGGIIADRYGWRAAFLVAGLPGLVIALLILFTVAEPRRKPRLKASSTFIQDARLLWRKRAFRLFVIAGGLLAATGYGIQAFVASFLFRNHAAEIAAFTAAVNGVLGTRFGGTGVVGPTLGLLLGLTGLVSAVTSGLVTDRLVARDQRRYGLMAGLPLILAAPILVAGLYWPGLAGALALIGCYAFVIGLSGPAWAASIQSLAPAPTRATASALALLAMVVFGNGLGPFAIGLISDGLGRYGLSSAQALRGAMALGAIPALLGSALFLRARRYLAAEIEQD
jgi:MFS family permease